MLYNSRVIGISLLIFIGISTISIILFQHETLIEVGTKAKLALVGDSTLIKAKSKTLASAGNSTLGVS